jgi:ribonuclease E
VTLEEPADTAVEQPGEPEAPAAAEPATPPAPPKVVTRTRRRSASRPAGPPVATGTGGDVPRGDQGTADAEPGRPASTGDTDAADEPHPELHVPIKKKGSRKR